MPKDQPSAKALAARTLTNLYNERSTWLALAHQKLDEAVFAGYGWEPGMSDEEILGKLLELNLRRVGIGGNTWRMQRNRLYRARTVERTCHVG